MARHLKRKGVNNNGNQEKSDQEESSNEKRVLCKEKVVRSD